MMHSVDQPTWRTVAKHITVAVGVVALATIAAELAVFGLAVTVAAQLSLGSLAVVAAVTTQTLLAVAAVGFVWYAGSWSAIPIQIPSRRDLRYAVVGVGGLFAVLAVHRLAIHFSLVGEGGTLALDGEIGLLATVGLVIMVALLAPVVEELLFRGVIQQYVQSVSSTAVGIGVAAVLFAGIHLSQALAFSASLRAAAAQLVVLAVLGVILGIAYEKTRNLAVPILMHAAYNIPQIALLVALL